jgi:hypothetical protein
MEENLELAIENQAAVLENEPPQGPHNNTTGEMMPKMIQMHQQNGPIGDQNIVNFRNSISYNDPELNTFMCNPNDELRTKAENNDEDNESYRILEELFPGYAMKYHEDYINT